MNKYIIFGIILYILLSLILQVIDVYYMESIILRKKYTPKFIDFIQSNINKKSKNLFFIPHLELGDSIILNGVVRYYCCNYDNVIMVCKKSYYDQIKFMYSDLNNLILYQVPNNNVYTKMSIYIPYNNIEIKKLFIDYNIKFLVVGCFNIQYRTNVYIPGAFPLWIYNNLQIDHSIAYSYFKINRNYDREDELYNKLIKIIGLKYIVIIDDEKRNYTIDNRFLVDLKYPIFKLGSNSTNLNKKLNKIRDPIVFNYIKILENASEIISIDSSIPWIIDMLNIQTKTTVHTYMRGGYIIYNNKNIKIIDGTMIERLSGLLNYNTISGGSCGYI
jgi:hypothetical protein